MKEIWVADDDRSIRWVLQKALEKAGFACTAFSSGTEVLERLGGQPPDALISDIRMPGISGIELLEKVKERWPKLPVIITTAYSDLDSAVSAFQGGAFEYLPKPFDLGKAVELVRRAVAETEEEEAVAEAAHGGGEGQGALLVGKAPAMQEVFRAIGRLSHSAMTVLITGQSGAGKEVVARALHASSPRSRGPFVALNMAAIPRELMESELFGHERGAFTGASAMRQGRFEQAKGGTLFLDEIGDMPMELQTRLLRVLSDGHYYRVGGHQLMQSDVRIIAATNQDLEGRVARGLFREDLFHRLNVIRLRLPALRDRASDIPELARHFLARSAQELGTEPKRLSDDAMRQLCAYRFPGNVRELENICRWITVMAPSQVVRPEDLPEEVRKAPPGGQAADDGEAPVAAGAGSWEALLAAEVKRELRDGKPDLMDRLLARFERTVISTALDAEHGRKTETAFRLGIGRNTITRKIRDLGLEEREGGQ